MAGGLFVEQTDPLQIRREMCCFQAIYALPLHPHLRYLGSNDFLYGGETMTHKNVCTLEYPLPK